MAAPGQSVPTTETATDDGAVTGASVGGMQDSGQEPADPLVAEFVGSDADTGSTEAGQAPAEVQPAPEDSMAIDSSATDTLLPDPVDEADLNPSPLVDGKTLTLNDDSLAAEDPGLVDTAPVDADALEDTGNQAADLGTMPTRIADSGDAEGTSATLAVDEATSPLVTEESADEPEMPSWIPTITLPEGSETWDENQWNEFLDSDDGTAFIDDYNNAMMESPELQMIIDILTDFSNTGDETYLEELWEYLNELFPDNPEWAQEAFDGIMAGMDEWDFTEPDVLEPSTPTEQPQEQSAEIRPAGTVIKPVLDKKPVAQAVAKPIVESQRHELANTGSNGTLVTGGVGVVLLLGGALTLGMRRRQKGL
ncbi:LPXTG cell wall anchor domain-containing protein [Paeniglutamicibacter sp.]|uniref:LPXTG cell wall anchor domain-containing protein n=1 Tax=Paeniglutamicibacter sp. TaxID=1934391 RepID=UPI00398A4F07